jgi:hypothetical protein
MLRWLARCVVLGTLLVVAACNRPVKPSGPVEPPKPDAVVTADELLEEYAKNEIAADQKYKDKLVQISGKVTKVEKTPGLGYYVGLGTAREDAPLGIMCYLDSSAEADAAKLNSGDSVSLLGYCRGKTLSVMNFKSCVIVK